MQAGYALIEFNYERCAFSDIVEIWDDEAGVRTFAVPQASRTLCACDNCVSLKQRLVSAVAFRQVDAR
jgi:hypothetical protein